MLKIITTNFLGGTFLANALIFSTVFLFGCTNSRIVQPLNQGQWQAAFSAGGPIITGEDATMPLGLSSISAAYGLTQSITAFSGMGISSELQNIHHFDAGITYELLPPFDYQPGITISPQLNLFRDKTGIDTLFYPQLDINAYWLTQVRHDFFYVGMSNWFETNTQKAHKQKQTNLWIPSAHMGYTFQTRNYGLNLELKYIAPNKNNQNQLIEYVGIDNKGVLGVYLSISRKFR